MTRLSFLSVITACMGIASSQTSVHAGGHCQEGGVSYQGRIVMKIHKTWLGASPAPTLPVFVQQAPPMIAVPYVAAPTMIATPPVAPAAPVAPQAPTSPAAQRDLDELRASVAEIRNQMVLLSQEVKAIRVKVGE
ncbi:MAG: hypothetical protein JWP89_2281 [Schlesneria sp.]|nr:hypothetical protein [Schlesneria sp.]